MAVTGGLSMRFGLAVTSILMVFTSLLMSTGWTEQDVMYFRDGNVAKGRITAINGEFIDYTDGIGKTHRINRLSLASRNDQMSYHYWRLDKLKTLTGELIFLRPSRIEMKQANGRLKMWPWMRHQIILGQPVE